MSFIFPLVIDFGIAAVLPDATSPLGYGSDLSCGTDLTETMDEVDPFSTLALAEACYRRLDCPRGKLPDDGDYGISIRSYLNRGVTNDEIRGLESDIRGELQKDDRVESSTARVTPSSDLKTLTIDIAVFPVDPRTAQFKLTLVVTSSDILLQELAA